MRGPAATEITAGSGGCRRTRASGSRARRRPRRSAAAARGPRRPRAAAGARTRARATRDQAVDRAHAALGRDDELGPARRRPRTTPSASATVSSARTTVVPTAITRPPRPCTSFDEPGGRAAAPDSARGTGARPPRATRRRVQRDRGDQDAVRDELGDQLGGERPRRARHLGAAGLAREDRLVVVDRPRRLGVAVADRVAVAAQVRLDRLAEREPGDRRAGCCRGTGASSSARTRRRGARRARPSAGAPQRRALQRAELDDPVARLAPAGVERCSSTVLAVQLRRERRRQRRRRVHHEEVAGVEGSAPVRRSARERGCRSPGSRPAAPRPPASSPRSLGAFVRLGGAARWLPRSPRHLRQLACLVAAARQRALDQGEQAGHARPRAAAGRRRPRRGTRPAASGCACRLGRPSRRAGRGARPRESR